MDEQVKIELEPGITFYVQPRTRRWVPSRGRGYTPGYYTATDREMTRKSRMSVHVKNEDVFENMVNRRNRPVDEWRKILRDRVFPKVGLPRTGMKWSQYAYCSCPCSPAFILPGWFDANGPIEKQSWDTCDFTVEIDFAIIVESSASLIDKLEASVRAAQVASHVENLTPVPVELVEA